MPNIPLAERLRPRTIDEYIGQEHLVGKNGVFRKFFETGNVPSFILWGPPGVGKTTLAQQLAESLHVAYLDTGAMFRCLALKLGPGAETLPEEELREKCRQWTFSLSGKGRASTVCCNGVPIRGEVRTEQVGMLAARIATVPVVREMLREKEGAR